MALGVGRFHSPGLPCRHPNFQSPVPESELPLSELTGVFEGLRCVSDVDEFCLRPGGYAARPASSVTIPNLIQVFHGRAPS